MGYSKGVFLIPCLLLENSIGCLFKNKSCIVLFCCLQPGGIWINLGPLQWHWADSHAYLENEEMSLEVSLDTVVDVAKHIGFHFVHGERGEEVGRKFCHYLSSPNSMRPQGYECALWVVKKPE